MNADEKILLGTKELTAAERLRSECLLRGVTIELLHNNATCTKGCAITTEIWAQKTDLPTINQVLEEQRERLMAGLTFDPNLLNEVFDINKAEATCPCCGTSFATTENACPDCGLVFVPGQ